ncbi:MAG: DUF6745 domain-containing protein, partial [Chloroflexota bacterium]
IGGLEKLEHISVANTRISDLSQLGGRLLPMRALNIENTQVAYLPDDLKVTEYVQLGGTTLTSIPTGCKNASIIWYGLKIEPWIATNPEKITAQTVLAEENTEVRRVMLERMGMERFIAEANPTVLDRDTDPGGERRLLQVNFTRSEQPLVVLSVKDPSTGRSYLLRVPPDMETCHQAAAWIAGFDDPDDYNPIVET